VGGGGGALLHHLSCPVGTVELRQVVYGLHECLAIQLRPVGTTEFCDSTVPTGRNIFSAGSLQAVNDLPKLNRRYAT
jgi:hypothetical protein